MTFDFKKFSPPAILGLTLGKTSLSAICIRRGSETLAQPPLSLPIGAEAILANPAKAGAELAAMLHEANLSGSRCAVCIPPAWVLSTSTAIPDVNEEDLRSYFALQAEREFSIPDLVIAHNTYPIPWNGANTRRATLAAIPAKRLEAIHSFLKAAGCNPVSISLGLPGCFSTTEPTLHLFCGDSSMDVAVSFGGGIAAVRTISSDPGSLARELRITLGRLHEGIRANLKRARVCGPFPPILPDLLEKLGLAPSLDETEQSSLAAQEAARLKLNHSPVPFEFFTPEPNPWEEAFKRFNTTRGRRTILAAAASIFLPVLIFSYRSHEENRLNKEWNAMRNPVAELEFIQQKIRNFRPWFEVAPQKLQALKTIVAAFPERGDIWTRSVQLSPYIGKTETGSRGTPSATASAVTINAFSQNNAALMNLQGTLSKQAGVSELQLKQLRGNNPIQFSLTFKWEPHHD